MSHAVRELGSMWDASVPWIAIIAWEMGEPMTLGGA